MFAFTSSNNTYYSPNHTGPAQDFANVAEHASSMDALRAVIEAPVARAHEVDASAASDFEAHVGFIALIQRGTEGALSAARTAFGALADKLQVPELPRAVVDSGASIKPDAIYTSDTVYVRKP